MADKSPEETTLPEEKVRHAREAAGNRPDEPTEAERIADPSLATAEAEPGVDVVRAQWPTTEDRLAADPALEPELAQQRDRVYADEVEATARDAGIDVHRAVGTESATPSHKGRRAASK